MSVLIKGGIVVTQDSGRRVLVTDVLIEKNKIKSVGRHKASEAEQVIDAKGKIVMPGLINLHGHVSMSTMRGIADDVTFDQFLERTFAADAKRTKDDILEGARLGCMESLLTGTTSFLDLYYGENIVAKAVEEAGIRGFLSWAVLDDDKTTQKGSPIKNAAKFIDKWKGHKLVTPAVGPQGIYVCSEETMHKARELADRKKTFCHYHLSETRGEVYRHLDATGKRPVDWLADIDFLSAGDVAAHVVWVTKHETAKLTASGVSVAHCPTSNLKLAVGGVSPVIDIKESGGTVGLGTDGCSSNNSLDMFTEMKVCALIHKHSRWNPTAMSAQQVLDMATVEGAKALGMEKKLGSIEEGKLADIVVVDSTRIGMVPTTKKNAVSNLVYSCSGQFVFCTMVDGKIVAFDGQLACGA
ncbi:MAG TPA: amidohydrolase family protein [Thermoplasmata archaeon]|nr:amidohydrolase family protein [Thermoplasmata archaeon]